MRFYHCECGRRLREDIPGSQARIARHRLSALHRNLPRMLALLDDSAMSYEKIAARLHLRPGRVSRIVHELGFANQGLNRRFAVTTETQLKKWWLTVGRHPAIRKCVEQGFDVQPIERFTPDLKFLKWSFRVNGHLVTFAGFWVREKTPEGVMCVLKPKKLVDADFQIAHTEGLFYVFPRAALAGISQSGFVTRLMSPPVPLTKSMRHDYRRYRDAWHLLGRPKRRATKDKS